MKKIRVSKPSKLSHYFNQNTEIAIKKYLLKETEKPEKDRLYEFEIRPAYNKLVENLIYIFGINTDIDYETLKHDCVVFLFENTHKYDPTKGTKAFSYFNIVAKNWLILKAKQSTRRMKHHVVYNDRNSTDELTKYNLQQGVTEACENDVLKNEFFLTLADEVEKWKTTTKNKKEQVVLDAIQQLFDNIDNLNILDKKAVFIYLKELTGMNTKQLCVNINKIRTKYQKFKKRYTKDDG